eukprot:748640-Pyramimonas_sp.AAC.1
MAVCTPREHQSQEGRVVFGQRELRGALSSPVGATSARAALGYRQSCDCRWPLLPFFRGKRAIGKTARGLAYWDRLHFGSLETAATSKRSRHEGEGDRRVMLVSRRWGERLTGG